MALRPVEVVGPGELGEHMDEHVGGHRLLDCWSEELGDGQVRETA